MEYAWGFAAASRPLPGDFVHHEHQQRQQHQPQQHQHQQHQQHQQNQQNQHQQQCQNQPPPQRSGPRAFFSSSSSTYSSSSCNSTTQATQTSTDAGPTSHPHAHAYFSYKYFSGNTYCGYCGSCGREQPPLGPEQLRARAQVHAINALAAPPRLVPTSTLSSHSQASQPSDLTLAGITPTPTTTPCYTPTPASTESRSRPPSSTPVYWCASCNQPLATSATPLAEPGIFPPSSLPPPVFQEYFSPPTKNRRLKQHRRQSHPEFTRSIPGLASHHPQPGTGTGEQAPLLSPAAWSSKDDRDEDHQSRPTRKLGLSRNRLSVPVATPVPTASTSTAGSSTSSTTFHRRTSRNPRHHHAVMVGSDTTFMANTASTATVASGRTMMSVNDLTSASRDGDTSSTKSQPARARKPFVTKSNGRTYLSDPTLPYPLPVDLHELHRQSLRTLLLFQLFGGPVCSPVLANRPPTRVLDLCCGYGFWSMMCHSYFSRKGHTNIHFTGLDIAPLGGVAGLPNPGTAATAPPPAAAGRDRGSVSAASGNWAEQPPDKNMQWDFVQHDLRNLPLPFGDEEFDLVMAKETCLCVRTTNFQSVIDEYLRILKPGGVLEIWESDYPIRMLRPHVPNTPTTTTAPKNAFDPETASATNGGEASNNGGSGSNNSSSKKGGGDQEKEISELGAYILGNNTPLSGPQNNYLIEYNSWVLKYLESNQLLNWPCANVGSFLIQEPLLTNHGSKRLAIPLAEVRWEREGVGGVVTKDGKSYIDTSKAIGRAARSEKHPSTPADHRNNSTGGMGEFSPEQQKKKGGRFLGAAQLALRETALQTVLGFIEGMEPALREASGKKQDEWDAWMGKLMKELVERDGANCGECLEVGAWWARKVQNP